MLHHTTAAHPHFQAVNKYQKITALLRGDFPPGLLPPAPQGYIASRIHSLAGTFSANVFRHAPVGRSLKAPDP